GEPVMDGTGQAGMRLDETGEGRAVGWMLKPVRDVVEQESEGGHPEARDGVELVREQLAIGFARILDREPGREAVDEVDVVGGAPRDQLGEPRQLRSAIGSTPVLTDEGIVLRCIDEGVHPALAEEVDQLEPLRVRPRPPVEALDVAADREGRSGHDDPLRTNLWLSASPTAVLLLE